MTQERGLLQPTKVNDQKTEPVHSLLSRESILRHREQGNIIIYPFVKENIGGASVDVRMGENFYRQRINSENGPFGEYRNLWEDDAAEKMWTGPFTAPTVKEFFNNLYGENEEEWPSLNGQNLTLDDRVITLSPGEEILGHTIEFIGGNTKINTSMQARSSLGRSCISVCYCAGWGDPGFINRWTMEITNNGQNPVVLVVGRRVAQIAFWQVDEVESGYGNEGKYQKGTTLEEVMSNWEPSNMLPRLQKDREIENRFKIEETARQIEKSVDLKERQRAGREPNYLISLRPETVERGLSHHPTPAAYNAYCHYVDMGITPEAVNLFLNAIVQEGFFQLVEEE